MHPIVNHLIQLQELTLIRTEQKAQRHGAYLNELDTSIVNLTQQLSDDMRLTVGKMQKRDPIFIVPITHHVCAGCGLKLPISLIQLVHQAEAIHRCPICTRILYFPESPLRNVGKAARRCEPRKAGISRFSSQSLIIPKLEAGDRDAALREIADRMVAEGFVNDAEKLWSGALQRESIVSTTVEPGLAFPHVRGVEGGGLTLALAISHKGIKFDETDKSLTRMIFFMVIPTAASAFYLKLLAGLAETFVDPEARKLVMTAENQEKMWKALVKVTKKTIP